MKSKILKTVIVLMLLASLTMVNFIYVGAGFISYAASNSTTNHKNVEFTAELKDNKTLSLEVAVKNEGYLNGEINIENANFKLKNSNSEYVNKVEDTKLTLNQINAGTTAQFDVEIEPIENEQFDLGLLTSKTKINLNATYKDRTEKDINVKASREVKLDYTYNKEDNVEATMDLLTNKIVKVNGEDKRLVQISMNMGTKLNDFPIKEIKTTVTLPTIDGEAPTVVAKSNSNTMTNFKYEYDNKSKVEISYTNEANTNNQIVWKKQGTENVVLTLVYNKDAKINDSKISSEEDVTLYDDNTLKGTAEVTIDSQKRDAIMQVSGANKESSIFKGKLYSGIERSYEAQTKVSVNLANVGDGINITENAVNEANVVYNKTMLSKDNFNKILGENGVLTISNENGEVLTTLTNASNVDENGNMVVDYSGREPSSIVIKTTTPVSEGDLNFTHIKTIKADKSFKNIDELTNKITLSYGTDETLDSETTLKLEEATTEASLQTNKDTLSTVVENNVEMRAILKSNNEKENLYSNPSIKFELPESVENISITGIDLVYESELQIKNYKVDGRTITVNLAGTQTQYKESGIEGAILIVNANVKVNRRAPTQDSQITMTVNNNQEEAKDEKAIKVVAPTDMTVINNINTLGVETIGQEDATKVSLQRGANSKQVETEVEFINNNENAVQNVKALGTFPTKNSQNNIDTKITKELNVTGTDGAEVYYTENENATDDLQNSENGWQQSIDDSSNVKKYLITVPKMNSGDSVKATYNTEVPASLEYNQQARQGYTVNYENSVTNATNEMKATTINMETGVGPKLETKISASLNGQNLTDTSTVKNGEVIKYNVSVSNTGSEDVSDITLQGSVPEGTTLVEPEDNYEYTGSSYYKELDTKTYETKIDKLKAGDTLTKEYEVRVNSDTKAGTKLQATSTVKYGDVEKNAQSTPITTETGKLRVTVKRITDRRNSLYESGTVQYYAIIENISNEKQDNVTVKTNLNNALSVNRLVLINNLPATKITDEDVSSNNNNQYTPADQIQETNENELQTEVVDYKDELNIGSIEAGQNKVLSYDMQINKLDNTNTLGFSVSAKAGNQNYDSNQTADNVVKANVNIAMSANPESKYLNSGDTLEYTITVKNNGDQKLEGLTLKDKIPSSLTVTKVTVDGKESEELKEQNDIQIMLSIAANSEMVIKIDTEVNYSESRLTAESITNNASLVLLGQEIAKTPEITHIIEANKGENGNENGNNSENNDIANGTAIITGTAWYDANANGQRDDDEQLLSGIKVRLYNTETNNLVKDSNGQVLEATTNENGVYVLNNIASGKYIAVFDYNTTEYTLSKYRVQGASQDKTSSAILKKLSISGTEQEIASTDIIEITDKNVSDMNIGLIKLQNFDFKLEKYVEKVIIQDSKGSTVKEYGDETLARAEIDGKKVNGTTVLIEYKIRVTNVGEVAGYVRKIADYMPSDLKFNSELNKDWYETKDGLYTSSFANDKIEPGQSKEITLTLTKAMTENNLGLINNTAEITEEYNDLGLSDSNSTPGNKVKGENDLGSADLILGPKTGGAVYVGIAIAVVVVLAGVAYVIVRKNKKESKM